MTTSAVTVAPSNDATRRRVRLLWLIDSFNVGGAESLVLPFIRHHDRRRYDVVLCCLATIGGNPIERELAAEGVTPVNLGAKNLRDVAAFRRLLRLIRSEKIDLIHAHLTYASTWAAIASRLTGVAAIATLHVAPPTSGVAAIRDRILRFVLKRWAARAVMVSGALRTTYLDRGGLTAHKAVVVHNGIDVERFRRDPAGTRRKLEAEFSIPAGAPLAVTVSVLRPGKGVEVLLAAIPLVLERVPDAVFLIIGDGSMRAEWAASAEERGVSECLRWAGHRRDVDELLAGCDAFVHPSLADAFPTVLLEAMAAGLPVVASSVGGIPEIVDSETGTLVPAGDERALGSAIAETLLDRNTAARIREVAPREAARRFSIEAWLSRLDGVYEAVLQEKRR